MEGAAALPPPGLAAGLQELEPVAPRVLRRLVTAMMSGGRSSHQLDYYARLPAGRTFVCYEQLWRTSGRWDYVTVTNANRSVDHLGLLLGTLASLCFTSGGFDRPGGTRRLRREGLGVRQGQESPHPG